MQVQLGGGGGGGGYSDILECLLLAVKHGF